MRILAIEFASPQRGVAVLANGDCVGAARETSGRATPACALIEHALRQAGWERETIEGIAVGLGPGSYTGIRAAISLAQGWQLARGVRLLGLSTVESIAAQAQMAGLIGSVYIALDAQRNEFHLAGYEISAEQRRPIQALRLAPLVEVQEKAAASTLLIWPELKPIFPQGQIFLPDASTLGRLAAARNDFVLGEKLEPIYLREAAFAKAAPPRRVPNSAR